MAFLEFSEIQLPELANSLDEKRYSRLKNDLFGLLLTQRMTVFENQGGASGPWKPHSIGHFSSREKRVAKNRRNGPRDSVKILQDKGTLRNSFTKENAPHGEKEISGDQVKNVTHVEYAAIHNFGGTITIPSHERIIYTKQNSGRFVSEKKAIDKESGALKNGHTSKRVVVPARTITMPARPFDEFSDQDQAEISELIEGAINGG